MHGSRRLKLSISLLKVHQIYVDWQQVKDFRLDGTGLQALLPEPRPTRIIM